ncbi:NUDIX hydrolase [Cohnella herbarum]|uniref:NUDIX hydrolase n=1 Tax=Cohnella herbarum TaxID=2728023 RepID=UPI00210F66E3|nr:NUDIX domain-containing protein [Cohnella herbarum]
MGGVHCIPLLDNGNLMMVWDREEKVLTTIGGRLEQNETIEDGLDREVMEEAGIELTEIRVPFASWFWKESNGYTIYFLTLVKRICEIPKGYEKTGYVIMNFETALDMIKNIEGREERIEIIRRAGILSGNLKDEGNSR